MAAQLSPGQCILLAVHFASQGNIEALHSFTPSRPDALPSELVLRILLTYLPGAIEPQDYTKYVGEVASHLYLDVDRKDVEVDISSVQGFGEAAVKRKVKRLELLDIKPPKFPTYAPDDLLTRFICHRAYRIDNETGLINLIPSLVQPFLGRNAYIRTWYISVVLPVLRMELEYYPQDTRMTMNLMDFENLDGREGIDFLLQKVSRGSKDDEAPVATPLDTKDLVRDIRGLVGPWMYGHTERKRRKLYHSSDRAVESQKLSAGVRKISLSGVSAEDITGHDWEYMFRWMVFHSRNDFPMIVRTIDEWSGPSDVDLGGLNPGNSDLYLEDDIQKKLELQYAQASFASCYTVRADTEEVIRGAHAILARLAELLDFIPPPDLATSIESLPRIERHATQLDESQTVADLEPGALLVPEHPLTTPRVETYMLLQMMVYSAYQFAGLSYPISIVNVAKMHFYGTPEELLVVLRKILAARLKSSFRQDAIQWSASRDKLLWLWNWGIQTADEDQIAGAGVLGKIARQDFEEELLKCFVETGCYDLAISLYIKSSGDLLEEACIENIVLEQAMKAFENASNGNKTRGGMKKANDILRFREASSLITATHALSFYSLTLQRGVPFLPVMLQVSPDPIECINKVLEQNPGSYAKLDDLISIGRNLVAAGLPRKVNTAARQLDTQSSFDSEDLEWRQKEAERRISFMAIEAALREDDFETAYSYIVNRLSPPAAELSGPKNTSGQHHRNISTSSTQSRTTNIDDISWRAAFLAGRYRPSTASPPTLRRLEQRTELLSLALLLAPISALTEILAAWRRCEEETTSLQLSLQQADEDFDDRADHRHSQSGLPGNFTVSHDGQPALILDQKRREMGRVMGRTKAGAAEAPVSMFDLTRSAAQAFSKNAWTAGAGRPTGGLSGTEETGYSAAEGDLQQRVRKRDVVANAASGALASGLGWVLGAKPVAQQDQE